MAIDDFRARFGAHLVREQRATVDVASTYTPRDGYVPLIAEDSERAAGMRRNDVRTMALLGAWGRGAGVTQVRSAQRCANVLCSNRAPLLRHRYGAAVAAVSRSLCCIRAVLVTSSAH